MGKVLGFLHWAAAAVSALLLLAVLVLWPASYYRKLEMHFWHAGVMVSGVGMTGRCLLGYQSMAVMSRPTFEAETLNPADGWNHWSMRTWGKREGLSGYEAVTYLGVTRLLMPGVSDMGFLFVPWAWVAAVFAVWPGWWILGIRRRRRAWRKGMCVGCGYDLRMHGVGERCPECGRVVGPITKG